MIILLYNFNKSWFFAVQITLLLLLLKRLQYKILVKNQTNTF